jgi:hypothetical protein
VSNLFHAKEVTVTPSGSTVIILQDGPASFHVSVSKSSCTVYDYILNPTSMDDLKQQIVVLEQSLLEREYSNETTIARTV